MSGSGFDVDIDQLRDAAPAFSREATALEHAAAKLRHALAGLGDPWGNDEQGLKFAHVYTPHAHSVEKAADVLVQGLHSIHDTMADMADNHEETDRHTASGFTGRQGTG